MRASTTIPLAPMPVAAVVRRRIERRGEGLWRMEDFHDLPFPAVARSLSRMAKAGLIERLSKGTYYRPRRTVFGKSRPNPAAVQKLAARHKNIFPSGVAAASLLGFTTQNSGRGEVATSSASLPRKLVGSDTAIHTRRPEAWSRLSEVDAALLDFLRNGGRTSQLSTEGTLRRTLSLLAAEGRYPRLLRAAATEPPRVRALLGALGERLGAKSNDLARLRSSLNPLSRFDFGLFAGMPNARSWQSKEGRP